MFDSRGKESIKENKKREGGGLKWSKKIREMRFLVVTVSSLMIKMRDVSEELFGKGTGCVERQERKKNVG